MTSILRFSTEGGDFALPVEHVVRIVSATELGPLPDATDGVAGMVLDGGVAVAVTDVLGAGGSLIIVVEVGDRLIGVLADEVPGVLVLDDAQIGLAPAGQRSGLVSAIVAIGRATTMLLDPHALMSKALA